LVANMFRIEIIENHNSVEKLPSLLVKNPEAQN
jgi:hypothetical protein